MKTSFLILFFFCICLLVGHGLADAKSIAPRRKTLDAKQPNSNVSPNSCCGNRQSCYCPSCCYSGYSGGNNRVYGNECSQLSDSCFNSDNAMFNWHQTGKGPIQFTFKFSDDCCKAASRIGNDCARNELYQIITRACTGNNSDHNSDDPIGTGSGKCSPIVERCRSLGYAYHYSPGPDGKPKYQIQFSPECCNTVSQIADDCSSDKSVRTIIESCNPKGGNHSGGNDNHSGSNDHDGGNNHNGGNSTKGFLGSNGSPKCSPIVRKCMYESSYFSYHFKSGPDGVKYYVYEFAPDCCSEALQITGDCANDADVKIITDQCKSESG